MVVVVRQRAIHLGQIQMGQMTDNLLRGIADVLNVLHNAADGDTGRPDNRFSTTDTLLTGDVGVLHTFRFSYNSLLSSPVQ